MKRLILLALGMLLAVTAASSRADVGDSLWSRIYNLNDGAEAYAIVQTSDGGFLVAGETDFTYDPIMRALLMKTDANGDSLWTRIFSGSSTGWINSCLETSSNEYVVAGKLNNHFWLLKISQNGDSLWSRSYGEMDEEAFCVIETSDGGFLLVGYVELSNPPGLDTWVVRTDANGDSLWCRNLGVQWEDAGHAAVETPDGGFLIAGMMANDASASIDIRLAKIDLDGDLVWLRAYGGSGWDEALAIVATADGGYFMAGETTSFGAGSGDMWGVKVNSNGDSLWSHTIGGNDLDVAQDAIQAPTGGYLMAGFSTSFGAGSLDFMLAMIDSLGNSLSMGTYGGAGFDNCFCLAATSDGNYLLGGDTYDSFSQSGLWLLCVQGGTVAVESDPTAQPLRFALHPAHPNPFNVSTILRYELNVPSQVNLSVYDTAGRLAETLVNGWRAAGSHEVTFDTGELPSGMYLCRLQAGEFEAVQKIILLK